MATGGDLELESMKDGMRALRDALEEVRAEIAVTEQRARAERNDEVLQLRAAVVAGREHADELQHRHEKAAEDQRRQFEGERGELHETIAELRRRLEAVQETTPR